MSTETNLVLVCLATAAIDSETDSLIQKTIHEALTDCTMLTIAHRLNTVLNSDRIMVMEDGKIEHDRTQFGFYDMWELFSPDFTTVNARHTEAQIYYNEPGDRKLARSCWVVVENSSLKPAIKEHKGSHPTTGACLIARFWQWTLKTGHVPAFARLPIPPDEFGSLLCKSFSCVTARCWQWTLETGYSAAFASLVPPDEIGSSLDHPHSQWSLETGDSSYLPSRGIGWCISAGGWYDGEVSESRKLTECPWSWHMVELEVTSSTVSFSPMGTVLLIDIVLTDSNSRVRFLGLLLLLYHCVPVLYYLCTGILLGSVAYCLFLYLAPKSRVNGNGKAVFITGCDSGFGFGLAKRLDSLGFTVFAGCLLADSGGEGSKKLRAECSSRLSTVQIDVTDDGQVKAAVQQVKDNLPTGSKGLYALVNNAGVTQPGEVEWVSLAAYRHVMEGYYPHCTVIGSSCMSYGAVPKSRGVNRVPAASPIHPPASTAGSVSPCFFGVADVSE
ncbi:hypothetical protein Bbelb_271120 [Branchiostoma belcheri]|nr:hypothetical protein Bbelb_271120 [Branchiostoma belcheri]